MDWREDGILLTVRRHGETSAIIEVLTEAHGRHAGVVRGGAGKRLAPVLQPGAQLALHWRARLEDHLGTFQVEPVKSRAAAAMQDRLSLTGLSSMLALAAFTLPEREPAPAVYHRTIALADNLGASDWALSYLRWEMALLDEMGLGLDLSRCALTGSREDLAFVSPRTGRAVGRAAAGEWAARLLPLPPALLGQGPATAAELRDGFRVTGHFLEHRLAPALGDRPLPEARRRFVAALAREQSG